MPGALPKISMQPRTARIADECLQPLHVLRQVLDEGRELVGKDRRHDKEQADEHQHEAAENEQRGDQPADAALDKPVRQRIEQVRERRADDERQQNMMQ